MDAKIENLISDIGKLRDLTNSKEDVESIRQDLNYILPTGKCKEVIYTNNVDKLPFGCIVLPTLADINVNAFLITGDEVAIKEYKCERCGRTEWEGFPIPLELHHLNGVHNDNRLENLQILCPNCHALTDNYSGKSSNGMSAH